MQNYNFIQKVISLVTFMTGGIFSYLAPISGVITVVVAMYMLDFVAGYIVYVKKTGKYNIVSKRFRWSMVKLGVYLAILVAIFVIYAPMHMEDIIAFDKLSSIIMWTFTYVEGLSVVENLQKVWKEDRLLKILHYVLSVKFLQFIPFLSNLAKESDKGSDRK